MPFCCPHKICFCSILLFLSQIGSYCIIFFTGRKRPLFTDEKDLSERRVSVKSILRYNVGNDVITKTGTWDARHCSKPR